MTLNVGGGDASREVFSTDNVGLGDVTGNGLPAQAIEHGKAWADDGQLYSAVQDAENAASSIVIVGPGTYSESVVVDTANLTIVGCGRDSVIDGGSSTALNPKADGISIRNLAVKSTAGGGNSANGINITNSTKRCEVESVWVEESDNQGIQIDGTSSENRIVSVWCDSANIDSNDIRVAGDNNVIDDIIGSVNDAGSGNSVGETA